MIELAVLDLAGTTVADDGIVEAAFADALGGRGLSSSEFRSAMEIAKETMGLSKIEVFRMIFEDDLDSASSVNLAFEDAYAARVSSGEARPIPGAEVALDRLKSSGVLVGFTTGFSPRTRRLLLVELGWDDLADIALSPADAGRGRPYPDMILLSILQLGVGDVRSVAVAGDNPVDLESGSRAGAGIVAGVLTGVSDSVRLQTSRHTHIIGSIAEFPDLVESVG